MSPKNSSDTSGNRTSDASHLVLLFFMARPHSALFINITVPNFAEVAPFVSIATFGPCELMKRLVEVSGFFFLSL